LRQCLFEIRRSAGEPLVRSDREHLWIEPSAVQIAEDGDEPYAGLSGITAEFDGWLLVEQARRASKAFFDLSDQVEGLLADRRGPEALPLIEQMRRIYPLHDAWLCFAMIAGYRAGIPSMICKPFHEFSELLARELGISPASETRSLHDRLIAELTKNSPAG
jgi:DNA-binding SARP family transcriptional activator